MKRGIIILSNDVLVTGNYINDILIILQYHLHKLINTIIAFIITNPINMYHYIDLVTANCINGILIIFKVTITIITFIIINPTTYALVHQYIVNTI